MARPVPTSRRANAGHPADSVIVVGYDGSEESRHAVELAAERAGPTGTIIPLHIKPEAPNWLGWPYDEREAEDGYRAARRSVADIAELDTGSTTVQPETFEGDPAETLLRVAISRDATEIVVGARRRRRFRAIRGSVSRALLDRADRPVVVVPGGAVDARC